MRLTKEWLWKRSIAWVPTTVIPPTIVFLAWLLLFQMIRGLLMACTWSHRGEFGMGLIGPVMWHGLRFDVSMAAQLTLPLAVWFIWRPSAMPMERRIVAGLYLSLAAAGLFALMAEVEFYREFQMRLGPLAFEYFSGQATHNRIVLGMIWHGYPVLRWTALWLVVVAAFAWVLRKSLQTGSAERSGRSRLSLTLSVIAVAVVLTRGGFQTTPLRWGDAYWSSVAYANQMTENGLFAVRDAIRHSASSRQQATFWKKRLPLEEAFAITRKTVLEPGEELLGSEEYPLLRVTPPSAIAERRPTNMVLVIMESFSARFCGATGASFGATPNFDRLAAEGILFDRAFSAGTHTAQGVFASLCSIPNLPDYDSIMKEPLGQQHFRSLPAVFREAGFETLFLYNGLFSWDNKEGFFRHQGVARFVGREQYRDPVFVDPDWGVSDADVFHRALEEFASLSGAGKRFLGIILTLSNHAPFNLPPVPGLAPITNGGEQNQRLNGIHYADWALGQFMAAAQKTDWFENTLFVFVGDHGFGVPPSLTDIGLLHMHVPLLFYGPTIFGGRRQVIHTVAGQLDILPTSVAIAGLKVPHQAFGRDLFSLAPEDPGHAYVKRSGDPILGWIKGDTIALAAPGRGPTINRLDLGFPPSATPDLSAREPRVAQSMIGELEAFVETALELVEDHRASPP